MFNMEDNIYLKIKSLFGQHKSILTQDFEKRLKQSIRVLHFEYLWGSCKEAKEVVSKHNLASKGINLFDLIMNIYNRKRREHQAKFLLLHCFENALRSTLAVTIANTYNTTQDDWFLNPTNVSVQMARRIASKCKNINIQTANTFKIFDCFSLIDLQEILSEHWNLFEDIFLQSKQYKGQKLPAYNKLHLNVKVGQIRMVRNLTFHNRPTKIRFQKDLEILLLRMGYNLKDAISIGDITKSIKLSYNYGEVYPNQPLLQRLFKLLKSFITDRRINRK